MAKPWRPNAIIVTCEHAGRRVPKEVRPFFRGATDLLKSHRGWDPGALGLAERFAADLCAPLHLSLVSRLVVELNRSPHHPKLFSPPMKNADDALRRRMFEAHYLPYRAAVERSIARSIADVGATLHVSMHTFTPMLDGEERAVEIGVLYDPKRASERSLCADWTDAIELMTAERGWRIRKNQPYRGAADGFTTWLRRQFPADHYAGVEIEVNQRLVASSRTNQQRIGAMLADSIRTIIEA